MTKKGEVLKVNFRFHAKETRSFVQTLILILLIIR